MIASLAASKFRSHVVAHADSRCPHCRRVRVGGGSPLYPRIRSDSQVLERLPFTPSDPVMRELGALRSQLAREPDALPLAVRLARGYLELGRVTGDWTHRRGRTSRRPGVRLRLNAAKAVSAARAAPADSGDRRRLLLANASRGRCVCAAGSPPATVPTMSGRAKNGSRFPCLPSWTRPRSISRTAWAPMRIGICAARCVTAAPYAWTCSASWCGTKFSDSSKTRSKTSIGGAKRLAITLRTRRFDAKERMFSHWLASSARGRSIACRKSIASSSAVRARRKVST